MMSAGVSIPFDTSSMFSRVPTTVFCFSVPPVLPKLAADRAEVRDAHVEDDGAVELREGRPIDSGRVVAFVSRDEHDRGRVIAMRDGDAGVRRCRDTG